VVPGLALAMMFWVRVRVHADPSPPSALPAAPGQLAPATAPDAGLQRITVGLYLQNIPEIDIKTNSFAAELYLWFRWSGDYDPTHTFQITNAVNVSELTQIPIYTDAAGAATAELLPGGEKLQVFHIYGRFGHPFPLARYPFDNHEITLSIEDSKRRLGELVHDIDVKGSAIRPDLTVPGWTLSELHAALGQTQFATTFGDTRSDVRNERYSRVDFTVHIDRPVVGIVSKTVIPIALILLITFGAFFCQAADIDARLCLTITALISAVALQITAATELPPTGSLLLLDKIYILSYATILAVTFCCIAANRLVHAEQPERAARLDRWAFRIIGTGYFGLLVLFVMKAS
jgi:hypothetical protein